MVKYNCSIMSRLGYCFIIYKQVKLRLKTEMEVLKGSEKGRKSINMSQVAAKPGFLPSPSYNFIYPLFLKRRIGNNEAFSISTNVSNTHNGELQEFYRRGIYSDLPRAII